ncbi:MAG TPA: hypothetical protein ENN22_00160 [bacterium]|nr:hypothetical protein [bacterium]
MYRILIIICVLINPIKQNLGNGQTIAFQKNMSGYYCGAQATFDLYKPYASLFINLKKNNKPIIIDSGRESEIISLFSKNFLSPKFMLLQSTFYQLSALSSYLETDHPSIFNRFNTYFDINLIRSIGAGYKEPYAFTLFLGNSLFLSYNESDQPGKRKQSGSALAGFAFNAGFHNILDNIYVTGFWYQPELVFVGKLHEPERRRISWDFRLGTKINRSHLVRDVIVFSVERNHSSYQPADWSFFDNSLLKYRLYIPTSFSDNPPWSTYQYFIYAKKFPIKLFGKTRFVVIGGGICWEWIYHYDRQLKQFEAQPSGKITWLIQPNIEF